MATTTTTTKQMLTQLVMLYSPSQAKYIRMYNLDYIILEFQFQNLERARYINSHNIQSVDLTAVKLN